VTTETLACPACGVDNRSDRRYCRSCGTELGLACPSCGTANEAGDRFCGRCGTPLGDAQSPVGGGASVTSAVERRHVSILFADLVGSTTMAEGADVEAVRGLLDRYYALCREVVGRYGGAIEKFIGDAVMAVWGSPTAHEDDSERAVRSALDLVDAARALLAPSGAPLMVRAGVLTGEAAVTLGAAGQAMVAGDLVNTASRLQGSAAPGSVLVGDATKRESEAAIDYELVGDLVLKGKTDVLTAWRALRVAAGRLGSGRARRLEPPFVGRDDDLRLLKEVFLQTARERRARLVSITGTAGIGKSRLAWELEKYTDGLVESVYWHQGRSPAYGDGLAFWALAEMIRGRCRIAETDDATTARAKLAAMAADWLTDDLERARVEPRLAALLGLEAAPPGGAEELTAAWRTLFERIADRGPTVLVFEDLHWAEGGLLDFIEGLLASARAKPITVLALARPELIERRPTWGATVRNHLRLDLAPLDDAAMEMLLVGLAPGMPPAAIAAIRDRAVGIPLYAVETVRMLLDAGRLVETGGRFRLDGELGDLAVPDSLLALLGSRLDALDPGTRDLVGFASVLGISFRVDTLAAVAGREPGVIRTVVDDLVVRELFAYDDDPRSPERGQHRFLQGVLREVAYGRLSRKERQARHVAAAEAFAAAGGDELAGVVATHYLEAMRAAPDVERDGLRARALASLEEAAARSHEIGAYASAARYLGDAAGLAADDADRLRLREARLRELYDAADMPAILDESAALLEEAERRNDPGLTARTAFCRVGPILQSGQPHEAVRLLEGVRGRLGAFVTEDSDGIRLLAELGRCLLMAGSPQAAALVIEEALTLAEHAGLRDVIAELLASKGWAIGALGRSVEAGALLRGGIDFAERNGHLRAEFRCRMNFSNWASFEDLREAFEAGRVGYERARQLGYDVWAASLAGNALVMAVDLGEWAWVEQTTAQLDPEPPDVWRGQVLLPMAIVQAYRGDMGSATATFEAFGRLVGATEGDLQILSTLGNATTDLALARGDIDDAVAQVAVAAVAVEVLGHEDVALVTTVALLSRNAALAERASGRSPGGKVGTALITTAVAAAAAIRGDRSALRELDRATARVDELGLRFVAARLRYARARFDPADPGARGAAEAAATVFRELGVVTLLRDLEPLLTSPAAAVEPEADATTA
jgi:class 3 adenylate cyclase